MATADSFGILDFIRQNFKRAEFTDDEWKMLSRCTTPEYVDNYLGRSEVISSRTMYQALLMLRARYKSNTFPCADDFDRKCLMCVLMYEDVRTAIVNSKVYVAQRTRKSGKVNGWKQTISNTVMKGANTDSNGFAFLKKHGRLDASFEAFVLNHSDQFNNDVVASAYKSLAAAGFMKAPSARDVARDVPPSKQASSGT